MNTLIAILLTVNIVLLIISFIKDTYKCFWKNCEKCEFIPNFPLTFSINNIKITGGITMLKLANDQLARFVVGSPKDIKGEDTLIEAGSLKVTSSNDEVFKVEADETQPDNNTAFKVVAGRSGAAVLRIAADADLDETGVKEIFVEIAVEVTTSGAVGFGEPTFAIEQQVLA